MKVKVELCWTGGASFTFRLTLRDGRRFTIAGGGGGHWTRETASAARRLLAMETGAARFRFEHV